MAEPTADDAHRRTFGALTVSASRAGDVHTIRLEGELDLANAAAVERELTRLEGTGMLLTGDRR